MVAPVLEAQEARQEVAAECLGGFSRQQRRQVVDADDAELGPALDLDRHGGLVKGGSNGVDGDRCKWRRGVCRYIAHHAQLAIGILEALKVDLGELMISSHPIHENDDSKLTKWGILEVR